MQRSRLGYVLALSLLVNVGVLAAAAWHARGQAPADVPRALGLSAEQRQRWETLEQPFLADLDRGWREVAQHRELLIRELFRDQPDAGRVEAQRSRIAELQAMQQKRVIAQLLGERELLDARQRALLLELLLREPAPVPKERELHGS